MRLIPLLAATALAAALSLTYSPMVSAFQTQQSSADLQTLHDYTLTEGFLKKWETIAADPNKPPCSLMALNLPGDSLDEIISNYDARPGNHAYLASHGLTSRDMVLGTLTLAAAAMQEMSIKAPKMVESNAGMQVSEQNMTFHKSHKAGIYKFMQRVGQERIRQDGEKFTDCPK